MSNSRRDRLPVIAFFVSLTLMTLVVIGIVLKSAREAGVAPIPTSPGESGESVAASSTEERKTVDPADRILQHVQQDRWDEATEYVGRQKHKARRELVACWKQLNLPGQADATAHQRYKVLDFYWHHFKPDLADPETQDNMGDDYLRLAEAFNIPPKRVAFDRPSFQLCRRYDYSVLSGMTGAEKADALAECIEVLERRPWDLAALFTLEEIDQHYDLSYHVTDLERVCTSSAARTKLFFMVQGERNVSAEIKLRLAEAAIPHAKNDEERGSMLSGALYYDKSLSAAERAEIIFARYPKTKASYWALLGKIMDIAKADVHDAATVLEEAIQSLGLNEQQVLDLRLAIVRAAMPDRELLRATMPLPGESLVSANAIEATKMLGTLAGDYLGKPSQIKIADVGVQFADTIDDALALDRWARLRLELQKGDSRRNCNEAPTIGLYFMRQQQWDQAYQAWSAWEASSGWCASWDVFPSEYRYVRMAVCLLHQGRYQDAIELIAQGMTDRDNDSRQLLPFLLFHIYDRAGQADDFLASLNAWKSDQQLREVIKATSHGMLFGSRMHELLGLQRGQWTVHGMYRLRELAAQKQWQMLRTIHDETRRAESSSSTFRLDFRLEQSIPLEAARLLNSAGENVKPPGEREAIAWPAPPKGSLPAMIDLTYDVAEH